MKLLKCSVYGNIVETIEGKGIPVMCCGKPMDELKTNTADGALERHVPVAEIADGNLYVKIGSMEHSMPTERYITMILAEAGDNIMRKSLKPGGKPEGVFPLGDYRGKMHICGYCNLHGLWKTDIEAQPIQNKEHQIVLLFLSLCIDKGSVT